MIPVFKTLLILPLFAFYICALIFAVVGAREKNAVMRSCYRACAWALAIGGALYDLSQIHPHQPLGESLVRLSSICIGMAVGYLFAAQIVRRNEARPD